jgi:hypothetical protein
VCLELFHETFDKRQGEGWIILITIVQQLPLVKCVVCADV